MRRTWRDGYQWLGYIARTWRVFEHIKIKRDINQDFKIVYLHLSNLNIFQLLEVVDRASETQLQVGEKLNLKIRQLRGKKSLKTEVYRPTITCEFKSQRMNKAELTWDILLLCGIQHLGGSLVPSGCLKRAGSANRPSDSVP